MTDYLLIVLIVLFTLQLAANLFAAYYAYKVKKSIDLRLGYFVENMSTMDSRLNLLGKVIKTYEDAFQLMKTRAEDVQHRIRLKGR
jgi:hypothetical protein